MIDAPALASQLSTRDFLHESECAEFAQRIVELRGRWTSRSRFIEYFTLGAAAYLDGAPYNFFRPNQPDPYPAAAAEARSILSCEFGDLYTRLLDVLAAVLDEPVAYDERLALPGFQIYQFDGSEFVDGNLADRAHFDFQSTRAFPGQVPEATLSFTVLIEQPTGGAGLALWPLRREEMSALGKRTARPLREFARQNPCERFVYTRGQMMLFDGMLLHAADGPYVSAPSGRRITLQGHGFRNEGQWTIYW